MSFHKGVIVAQFKSLVEHIRSYTTIKRLILSTRVGTVNSKMEVGAEIVL